jgi:hypothetical protein
MEMDMLRWIIELLVSAFALVLWYLLRKVIADVRELEKAFSDYKLHVSENFVHHDTFKRIEDKLDRLLEKVYK